MSPSLKRWQASISILFSPGTRFSFILKHRRVVCTALTVSPDSVAASCARIAAFLHVVIMLKKGMIVKESARRIRYSRRVDDIRLEGHDAALFI